MSKESLLNLLKKHEINSELIVFEESVKDSKSSASASKLDLKKIVKTVTFKDKQKKVYAVIIRATERVCKSKLKGLVQKKLQLIPFDDVIKYTSFPAGGVPPFGYDAFFIIDSDLSDLEEVLVGGGDIYSLLRIKIKDLKKLSSPVVCDVKQ